MEKYCINTQNVTGIEKDRQYFNTTTKNNKTSSFNVKQCFTEYTIEDKIQAIKNILTHNEKHEQHLRLQKNSFNEKTSGMKECLQGDRQTPFQTFISELRNTVTNSYWNQEVGKTRYEVPNLPVGMNSLQTTFGKIIKSSGTMAEILKLHEKINFDQNILEMYKKSHNSYQPAERINRYYNEPFNQNNVYGKPNKNLKEGKVKSLLTWSTSDPKTIVNSILADFKERSNPNIGEIRNLKNAYLYTNMVHSKPCQNKDKREATNILSDCPVNNEILIQENYLQYINNLRLKLKYHDPEIPYLDIYENLFSLDKEYKGTLPDDEVFSILTKHKIYINKTLLTPLLNILQISNDGNMNYTKLLNLLNWKYDFPTLPKIDKISINCQYYTTTYNETIGDVEKVDMTLIPAAGISYETWENAYSLIFPNIFTRYGFNHGDLTKPRQKEEIRSIFECIGVKFPDDSFNLLWKKGQKDNGIENLSIETFKNLLDQHDLIIQKGLKESQNLTN